MCSYASIVHNKRANSFLEKKKKEKKKIVMIFIHFKSNYELLVIKKMEANNFIHLNLILRNQSFDTLFSVLYSNLPKPNQVQTLVGNIIIDWWVGMRSSNKERASVDNWNSCLTNSWLLLFPLLRAKPSECEI